MKNVCAWMIGGLVAFVLMASAPVLAEPTRAEDRDRLAARAVQLIMSRQHISRADLNDILSERLHKQFLQMLDPQKLYFLQGDIDEFAKTVHQHDDEIKRGDLSFPFDVYKVFVSRLDERADWVIDELAVADYDFTQEDEIVVDPKTAKYAKSTEEAKDRWRAKTKFELLSLIVDGTEEDKARERLQKRYRTLKRSWHNLSNDELVEMFLTSLTTSFDPHSTYMSDQTLRDFKIGMQLSLEGIGAILQSEDGSTILKELVPGGAADKSGYFKPGDSILAVGQADGEMVDIAEMKLRDVVDLIRGKAGTPVRLEVKHADSDKRNVYTVIRQKVQLQDREAKGEVIDVPDPSGGAPIRVGVVKLPSFYADDDAMRLGDPNAKSATRDVDRILAGFRKENVSVVVVDLRANGGGLLSEAISLTGLFIDQGPVVQVKDSRGRIQRYNDESAAISYAGPLVVLVSKFSASASEIFAGAIQDYRRGIVVGDSSTHGKGTVQQVISLSDQFRENLPSIGALKITGQLFYRVSGDSTQNKGVVADIMLPSPTDDDDFSESKLDYALKFDQIPKAPYEEMSYVSPTMINALRDLSAARFAQDPELKKLAEKKQRIAERRKRTRILFSEERLREERRQIEEDREKDVDKLVEGEEGGEKNDAKFGSDAYTKEVLSIAADLARATRNSLTQR